MLTQKSRRCFHRVYSGIQRGGELRFMTLTSGPNAPLDIERSWRKLYMRLQRKGLFLGYIKVAEYHKNGRKHLHILYRGSYIDQKYIGYLWWCIHRSPVVKVKDKRHFATNRKMASYMAKYMSKESAGRCSWSWHWVWPGFCRHWNAYKSWYTHHFIGNGLGNFSRLLLGWQWWLQERLVLHIPHLLMGYSASEVVEYGPSKLMLKMAHPAYNMEVARCHV